MILVDHITESEHNTNFQQDDSEITEEEIDSNMVCFTGKVGIKWKNDLPAKNVRTRTQKLLSIKASVR